MHSNNLLVHLLSQAFRTRQQVLALPSKKKKESAAMQSYTYPTRIASPIVIIPVIVGVKITGSKSLNAQPISTKPEIYTKKLILICSFKFPFRIKHSTYLINNIYLINLFNK